MIRFVSRSSCLVESAIAVPRATPGRHRVDPACVVWAPSRAEGRSRDGAYRREVWSDVNGVIRFLAYAVRWSCMSKLVFRCSSRAFETGLGRGVSALDRARKGTAEPGNRDNRARRCELSPESSVSGSPTESRSPKTPRNSGFFRIASRFDRKVSARADSMAVGGVGEELVSAG